MYTIQMSNINNYNTTSTIVIDITLLYVKHFDVLSNLACL